MNFLVKNSPALIPLLFLSFGMLIPLISWKKRSLAWPVIILVTLAAVGISVFNVSRIIQVGAPIHYHMGGWLPPLGIEYVLDHLSAFVMLVINSVALLVLFHGKKPVNLEVTGKEMPYYSLVSLMLAGFNGIVVTGDMFNLYVFLEICSLSLYGLISIGETPAPVAALRYLFMGTIAATFYLTGLGFLYITGGSLNMADIKAILPHIINQPAALVALVLMVLGMAIKMALFPLHGWLPDAYTYAPSTSSALIAPTGTKVASYVMIRVMFFIFGFDVVTKIIPLAQAITWLSAAGIIYGSILAIAQKELKRMLAYSSVAQVGYIGLGIGLANPLGLIGAVLHVLNHAFMKGCLFLVAANFRYRLGHSNIFKLDNSIRKKMPWTMVAFTVAALSMVGLPPMGGFFSKWYLAMGTIKNSQWLFLAVILFSSLLNAVYFFRIIEKVYMKPMKAKTVQSLAGTHEEIHEKPLKEEDMEITGIELGASMLIPTLIMAAAIIAMGLFNAFIVKGILAYIIPQGM
jgi:multicomponent Na+:H+ antiporter subunit D